MKDNAKIENLEEKDSSMQTLERGCNRNSFASPVYRIDYPHSPRLLDELYEVDCQAYGRHAVDRSILARWVEECPESITLMIVDDKIAGAFGLLAVSEEQIRLFIAGELSESKFISLPSNVREHRHWYWSGIVMIPQYQRHRTLLKPLLSIGLDSWLSSPRVGHPKTMVYATGCTAEGVRLLDRFKFECIKSAEEMKDGSPLYARGVSSSLEKNRQEIRELLGARS